MTDRTQPTAPPATPAARKPRRLFIAVPSYNGFMRTECYDGLHQPTATCETYTVQRKPGSLLAYIFNQLWHACYNSRKEFGWTHFAMMHADVEAPPLWADVLLEELERTGAAVVSCVIPIKDGRGLTSTGMADPDTGSIRRLTMAEVFKLPETFGAKDVIGAGLGFKEGAGLAANTGLWVCDFERLAPYCVPGHAWKGDPGLHFSILDGVREGKDGKLTSCVLPEDWNFSRACRERGLEVLATRKVKIQHYGDARYPNSSAWGDWPTDRGDSHVDDAPPSPDLPEGPPASEPSPRHAEQPITATGAAPKEQPAPAEEVKVDVQIRGDLTPEEARALALAAQDKVVLEMGSFEGASAAAFACSARKVHCVDWHQGDDGAKEINLPRQQWTLPAFASNLRQLRALDKVVIHAGLFDDVLPLLPAGHFDLVLADLPRDYEQARAALPHACRLVKRGGAVVVQGLDCEEVRRATRDAGLGDPLARVGRLGFYDPPRAWAA